MNIVLLGAPGSGKGTQAEMLADKLKLFYLQTGDLAREWAEKDPGIKKIIEKGELIPEKKMTRYVMKVLEEKAPEGRNILFEGFPRFISQYKEYEKWLASKGQSITGVIFLDLSEDEAIKRLSSRRTCEKCDRVYNLITNPPLQPDRCECGGNLFQRKDDSPEAIKVRFRYYKNNTEKLVNYLDSKGLLTKVDAERPIEVIFDDISAQIAKENETN